MTVVWFSTGVPFGMHGRLFGLGPSRRSLIMRLTKTRNLHVRLPFRMPQ